MRPAARARSTREQQRERRPLRGHLCASDRSLDPGSAGLALAEHWNFSDTMRLAIAGHHEPGTPGAGFLAAIVHVADALVHALDLVRKPDDLVPPVSPIAWKALNLSEDTFLHLFRETELQYEEIALVLMA